MSAKLPAVARVTRQFNTSAERVFDAWLSPEMIGRWMFGPNVRDEEVVLISVDARMGGAFSFIVRRQGQEIDHVGEYLEIDRPRRLVFTWGVRENLPDTSRVIIDIATQENGSELSLAHEMPPDWANFIDRAVESWTKMLAALATALG
jgi:uncharacterized protein YndB with AHSA1/START domain